MSTCFAVRIPNQRISWSLPDEIFAVLPDRSTAVRFYPGVPDPTYDAADDGPFCPAVCDGRSLAELKKESQVYGMYMTPEENVFVFVRGQDLYATLDEAFAVLVPSTGSTIEDAKKM